MRRAGRSGSADGSRGRYPGKSGPEAARGAFMKVIVAKTAGFCWGVRRAMDAVLEASTKQGAGPVQTLGPLIHNPQALELIGKRGVALAAAPDKVENGTVVIRARGIPIQDLRGLKGRAKKGELNIVNAT